LLKEEINDERWLFDPVGEEWSQVLPGCLVLPAMDRQSRDDSPLHDCRSMLDIQTGIWRCPRSD
jgi:hypothetical protein